jgi:hypothetical protein
MKLLIFILSVVILPGCALFNSDANSSIKYSRYVRKPIPPTSPDLVKGVSSTDSNRCRNIIQSALKSDYYPIGYYIFDGPAMPEHIAQKVAANYGADYFVISYEYNGIISGSRMVPVGYTTPSLITSFSQNSINAFNRYGNYSANTSGIGYSTSVVGGTTIYGKENYSYRGYVQIIYLLVTPSKKALLLKKGYLTPEISAQKPQ